MHICQDLSDDGYDGVYVLQNRLLCFQLFVNCIILIVLKQTFPVVIQVEFVAILRI